MDAAAAAAAHEAFDTSRCVCCGNDAAGDKGAVVTEEMCAACAPPSGVAHAVDFAARGNMEMR